MSKNNSITILFIGLSIAFGVLIGSFLNFKGKPTSPFNETTQEAKIKRLINYIQYDYVDAVDTDSLLDLTINQLLKNLDPHSIYIAKNELTRVQETMNGNFTGIGIQFRIIRDTVTVINVIEGGPSFKAKIKAGDRILIADQDTLFGKNIDNEKVMMKFKSNKPNKIDLVIYRKSENKYLNFSFNRGVVSIKSVPVYYMINQTIGFIKIDIFSRYTYHEFRQALLELKKQGMQTLVLDLRNNTGGFLEIANQIMDEFLPKGQLMVYTKSKSGKISNSFATNKGEFENGNLYVLINEESASASEIVAGAIQDNDRGTIVGRRSFGKGLVQQEMDLGDGSAVRLTTARYYTPTGRSIQKPYDHKGNENYFDDNEIRAHNGELLYKDSIPVLDSLKFKTPKGKIVYGGGGIIPDVFVPIDTTFFIHGFQLGAISDIIFDYTDNNRKKIEKWSFEEFNKDFDAQIILDQYYRKKQEQFHKNNPIFDRMKWYLKALVAREVFGEVGYYKIYQEKDDMIQEVLKIEKRN